MRDFIEVCRELELRRIDLVKGLGLCIVTLPFLYVGFMALWFVLSAIQDIVIMGRG